MTRTDFSDGADGHCWSWASKGDCWIARQITASRYHQQRSPTVEKLPRLGLCYGKKVFFDSRGVTEGRLGRAPAWGLGGATSVEGGSYYCRYDVQYSQIMDKKTNVTIIFVLAL